MKKCLSLLLAIVLLCMQFLSVPVYAEMEESSEIIVDSSVAPEPYYPFIYSPENSYLWLGETLNSQIMLLTPNYMYVANKELQTVFKVIETQVVSYDNNQDYVFAATSTGEIVRTDYQGDGDITIYEAQQGNLSALCYESRNLYFMDGNKLMRLNVDTLEYTMILQHSGVVRIRAHENQFLVITDSQGEKYVFSFLSNRMEKIETEEQNDVVWDQAICELPISTSEFTLENGSGNDPMNLVDTYITLPMAEYPVGSYFTTNGLPCVNHNRCKVYACSRQCDGFARYVNEHYYHVNDKVYGPYYKSGDISSPYPKYKWLEDDDYLYQFFNHLHKGAYVRVSSRNRADDEAFWAPNVAQGSHSFIYISHDTNGVTVYEANRAGNCNVGYVYYTYEAFLEKHEYFFGWVNHNTSGTVVNSTDQYHRLHCSNSGCEAYVVEAHRYTVYGTSYRCSVCGDITTNPRGPVVSG